MFDDGDPRCGLVGHLGQVGSLDTLLGVGERVEISGRQGSGCLHPDCHPGVLDDLEHLGDAVVYVADQVADRGGAVQAEADLTCG
jgi:hypothetical protein